MGGYENLPSPVPASQMVYNHVSRGSLSGFQALDLLPNSVSAGERHIVNFTMTIPDDYNTDELSLIAILSNPDGTINNVFESSFQEAIDHGFELSTSSNDPIEVESLNVYPNPASNLTFVDLDLTEPSDVRITVLNNMGQQVAYRDYGKIAGEMKFPVDLNNMPAGMYQIQIFVNNNFTSRKINVTK
jgi:hypothetical protein